MVVQRCVAVCVVMVVSLFLGLAGPVRVFAGSCDLQICGEPDSSEGWMTGAVVEIPEHMTISDLDVGVTLTQANFSGLLMSLESPTGTTVLLNTQDLFKEYEQQDWDQRVLVFDDEAVDCIGQAELPLGGRLRPVEPLSVFDGQDACGTWKLWVRSAHCVDTGCLNRCGCDLSVTIPEPASASLFLLAVVVSRLRRYSHTSYLDLCRFV